MPSKCMILLWPVAHNDVGNTRFGLIIDKGKSGEWAFGAFVDIDDGVSIRGIPFA